MQQVQPKSNVFIPYSSPSFTSSTTNASSQPSTSSRSGMRRLRTETTTSPRFTTTSETTSTTLRFYNEFHEHLRRIQKAFEKGKYDKALQMIDEMEPLIRKAANLFICEKCIPDTSKISSDKVEKMGDLLSDAILAESKAYFLALLKDPKAIKLCNKGFQKIHELFNILNTLQETEDFGKSFLEGLNFIENGHRFYRGLLQLGLGNREEAIRDLKSVLTNPNKPDFLDQISFWNTRELHLFFKALERKLDTQLLPPGSSEDEISICSSDNTEHAIQLFSDSDFEGARKAILAGDFYLYLIFPLVIQGFENSINQEFL